MTNMDKPAFPTNGRMHSDMTGLTKREYFAAHADIPWDAVRSTLEKKLRRQDITVQELIEYRVSLKLMEADELIKRLEVDEAWGDTNAISTPTSKPLNL